MGLSIVVGILPELTKSDPGNVEFFRDQFRHVNQALHHAHVAEHKEPEEAEGVPWIFDMKGFKTLHYLRRLAGYLCLRESLPNPGDEDCITDPINEQWCLWATNHQPKTFMAQLLGNRVEDPIPYEHLMVHSDANGFYLPQHMNRVVIAPEDYGVMGDNIIGSSNSLLADCQRIADAIGLPLDTDAESDEMREAMEKQGDILDASWMKYGIESYACLQLCNAAETSIASGCAMVFTS